MPNNPAGVDCREIIVMLQSLFAAAQPERYQIGIAQMKVSIENF
jgi:hypothetical protein